MVFGWLSTASERGRKVTIDCSVRGDSPETEAYPPASKENSVHSHSHCQCSRIFLGSNTDCSSSRLVANGALSGSLFPCDSYCLQANISPHKFIAFSNNDNQRETILLNELNNNAQAESLYKRRLTTPLFYAEYPTTLFNCSYSLIYIHASRIESFQHTHWQYRLPIIFSREQILDNCQLFPVFDVAFARS
ncbi:hypothetical protein T10_2724 [Trichinella papuae]|uniref:Uncharacterized protein n=1 Tax=Trichinella papuae TaxID=268474 RepID=A0A0V1MUU9_9BILA|nr:hypothetical protein T10_2724 [Trichinella papuae]